MSHESASLRERSLPRSIAIPAGEPVAKLCTVALVCLPCVVVAYDGSAVGNRLRCNSIEEFGAQLLRDRQLVHLVTDDSGEPIGVITLDDLRKVRQQDRVTTKVRELMRDVQPVDSTADAFDTLALLNQSGNTNALVEENGTLVGVLSQANYADAITFRRGFQTGLGG